MNKIKAIFFDIDGTLVGFNRKIISDRTIQALKQLRDQGILLFIATGRSKPLINNLKDFPFDGYVTMNGALVYYKDEIILSNAIDKDEALKIAQISTANKFACVAFMEDGNVMNFENEWTDEINKMLNIGGFPHVCLEDLSREKPIYQYTIYITNDDEFSHYRDVLKKVSWHRWHKGMSDAIPLGTSKAESVKFVMKHLGINPEETVSFGDGGNDLEMLQVTGLGIAMGNAGENVKQVADYVTADADEDGVVQALEYLGMLPM